MQVKNVNRWKRTLLASALGLIAALVIGVLVGHDTSQAKDPPKAPILFYEVVGWCNGSCRIGDVAQNATYLSDGSLHVVLGNPNPDKVCSTLSIPKGIDGWYVGLHGQDVDHTVRSLAEVVRSGKPTAICEAVFRRT